MIHSSRNLQQAGQQALSQSSVHSVPPPILERADNTSPERTDEQLLLDYRRGDKAAFSELVRRNQRELYHFLVRFLGNRTSAEDVFQETFLQVHRSAKDFDAHRHFRPWLFTIAANKAKDWLRRQARRPAQALHASMTPGEEEHAEFLELMGSPTPLPEEPLERREMQQLVQDTVAELPQPLREVLLLSYFQRFPYQQISDMLGIPLGTVKSRIHAAVAHFADLWHAAGRDKLVS